VSFIFKIANIFHTSQSTSNYLLNTQSYDFKKSRNTSDHSEFTLQKRFQNKKSLLSFVCFALIILLSRWYYVEHFAVSLPFWDQWDAEWYGLMKPWIEGKLQFSDLFKAHNEHRILPTRLMTLVVFSLTGTWNNLTEARLNIPLSAVTPLILIWLIGRDGQIFGLKWLVIAVILAGASLPFSWENILIGFQSQFYFLNLFTLCALALAVYRSENYAAISILLFLCILSILTSASGLLTSMTIAVIYSLRCFIKRRVDLSSCLVILMVLLISFIAYYTMPVVAGHHVLHAENIGGFFKAAARIMGWPLRGSQLHIGLMWVPSLITIPILILRWQMAKIDLLMIGCFVWTGMQAAALAYGRGHEIVHMPSRYSEVLLLGLAGNSWFVLRMPDTFGKSIQIRRALYVVVTLFFCAVFISYTQRTVTDFKILKEERERRLTQTANVCGYLKSKDVTFLNKKGFEIPYPDPKRLQQFLDDPELQKVLIINDCDRDQ
jgi:hypothetical protein